ncbi:hypothetical protein RRG08_017283 [Elysia crispata]|uniref:Uncharacterized protein n=1 Tax=Elysia crispata TaxID=231223 RepID=A0AAE0YPY6_9GAST|nr:hypothetical protein RRG08_017283 [Elysia crispata]
MDFFSLKSQRTSSKRFCHTSNFAHLFKRYRCGSRMNPISQCAGAITSLLILDNISNEKTMHRPVKTAKNHSLERHN